MTDIFFKIVWMVMCVCIMYIKKRWQYDRKEEAKLTEPM